MFGDYGFDNGYFAQQNNPYQPQMQNQNYGYQSQNAGRQRQPQNFNFQQQAQSFQQSFEFPRISGFDEIKNIHVWLVKFIEKERKERLQPVPQGMMDVWEWEHQQMVEDAEELELLMNNYQKM